MYARLVRYDDRGDIDAEHMCQSKATTIGRDVSNMVQLTEGDVSKKHAIISQKILSWVVHDLESSNGVFVNGKRVNIPSYQVQPSDEITLTDLAREQIRVKAAVEAAEQRGVADWLDVDFKAMKGTFKALPERSDLPSEIDESLVIALYSK